MRYEKVDPVLTKIIQTGIFLLIIFTPLIIEGTFYSYKLLFIQLVLSFIIFCFGLKILMGRVRLFFCYLFIPIFCYIVVNIYSFFLSSYPQLSNLTLLKNLTFITFFFIFIFNMDSYKILNRLIKLWVIIAGLVALYGILQFLGFDFLGIYSEDLRIFSSMGNPNFLAGYLVLTLPLGVSQIILSSFKYLKILFFVCCLFILTAIMLTFSRGGYLALVTSGVVYTFLLVNMDTKTKYKLRQYKIPIIIGFLLVGLVIFSLIFYLPGLKVKVINVITRPTARIYIWEGGFKMALDNPLKGFGLGTFPIYFPFYRPSEVFKYHPPQFQYVKHAHNMVLETWIESGIIGVVVFITFIVSLIMVSFSSVLKSGQYNFKNLILAGAFSSFCGIMVMNLVNVTMYYAVGGLFFWLIIGILIKLSNGSKDFVLARGDDNPMVGKLLRFLFSFVIIASSVALFGCSIRPFSTRIKAERAKQKELFFYIDSKVNHDFVELIKLVESGQATAKDHYALGTIFAKRRDWDNAFIHLNQAIKIKPDYAKAYNNLGNIYFHKGDLEKAIQSYKKALKHNPNFVDARYNLGMMYFRTGQIKNTVEEMEAILKIEPNNYEARAIINTIGE